MAQKSNVFGQNLFKMKNSPNLFKKWLKIAATKYLAKIQQL